VRCVFFLCLGFENSTTTDHILKDTFVKLNFGSESSLSEDTINNATEEEKHRGLRRKQNRHRGGSYEKVHNAKLAANSDTKTTNSNSKQRNMNSVNLVGIKANGHHFQEPHYEAIRDLSIKRGFKSHSNNTSPEGSPKLFHSRKYVLNNGLPLSTENSPKLTRTKKGTNKNPPLPKRNRHSTSPSPFFYSENGTTGSNNNIYGNTSPAEHAYTDVNLQKMKNLHNKQFKPLKVDHPYSEITPRPRRSLNSSDNDNSPVQSPDRIITPPFDKTRMFNPTIVVDGSKSDGDISDSDILDVQRLYNRRRSRTGNGADLPDPAIFYAVPDENKPRNLKQPYRNGSYEKDYFQTIIKPRPKSRSANSSLKLLDYPTYENSNGMSHENNELTYENDILHRGSSTDDDSEPTYENPDIRITSEPYSTHNGQPTYENNELLQDEAPIPGYACIRPSSLSMSSDASDSNYNNICFNKKDQLMYADIDINNHRLYDNLSSPELEYSSSPARNTRMYSVTKNSKYTEIDFTKSYGLKEALNQLRDSSSTPEANAEYKIDLSHIKFTKSSDSKRNSRNLEN